MIHEVKGDLLEAPQLIFAHQVNCQGVMGAGLARQIRERWPQVYEEYRLACRRIKQSKSLLGSTQIVDIGNGHSIANMFAQDYYGRDRRYTDYEAFDKCCSVIKEYLLDNGLTEIVFPKYIGCGLAGGDWEVIKAIVESQLGEFEIYFYER